MTFDPDMIQAEWSTRMEQAAMRKTVLYNSSLFRLTAMSISDFDANPLLTLHVADTDYREYVCTRDPAYRHPAGRADPLGTLLLPLTADGYLVLARRSPNLDVNPGKYFGIGGFFDRNLDIDVDGRPSIEKCVVREAREELGLEIETSRLCLLGVVYDLAHPHPELAFLAPTAARASSIANVGAADSELDELIAVELDGVRSFAERNGRECVDTMLGAFKLLVRAIEDGFNVDRPVGQH